MNSLTEWLIAIGSAGGFLWIILAWFLDHSEQKDVRLQKSEKENVLQSVSTLAEVMKEFRITQKETQKEVNELKLSVMEIKIQFASFVEAMDRYYRSATVDTGDGFKLDPRKVNKQK